MSNNKKKRSFGGKISDFDNKQERRFEGKHLEAYLRGDQIFQYGFNHSGEPVKHFVREIWT